MSTRWLGETRDADARVLYRIGRDDRALLAEWPGLARLRCMPGRAPELCAEDGADAARLLKIRQGIAGALVRSLDGGVTLHASAVARDGRAILCLGPSGAGKSTMAALLCARPGFAVVADDMCEVRWSDEPIPRLLAVPGERSLWLASEGSTEKLPQPQPAAVEVSRVEALVCMSGERAEDSPQLHRIRGAALFARLVPCLVRFALDDPGAHARELETLSNLCRVSAYGLIRARERARATEGADLLAQLLAGG